MQDTGKTIGNRKGFFIMATVYDFKVKDDFVPKADALNCGVYQINMTDKKDLLTRLMYDLLPHKGNTSHKRS